MIDTEKYMPELILKAGEIETSHGWKIGHHENLCSCWDCNSNLFYPIINWGIVANEDEYMVMWNRSKLTYSLREIGINLYCAKCGSFLENYSKYFYPADKLILDLGLLDNELDEDERAEIWNCLNQWNQKGDFKSRYKSTLFNHLKEQLKNYEKKHPIKIEKGGKDGRRRKTRKST